MDFLRNILHQSLGVIIEGGFVLLLVIALTVAAKLIIRNIFTKSKKLQSNLLKDDFPQRMLRPLRFMIWLVGASYLIFIFVARLQPNNEFEPSFAQFRNLVIIVGITWLCFELKHQMMHSWKQKALYSGKSVDASKILLTSKLVSITIFVISGLIILDSLGVRIGALLALGGVGGVTIGFAAKDVFANLFSGFMMHITKPFSVGDWVHSLDCKMQGTVEHIGFYLTRIRGFDKRPFYVPNSLFSSQITVNASRMTNRRIKKEIGVRYDDFHVLEKIVSDIKVMLKEHPEIDNSQHQLVDFIDFADSSLKIQIYCFTVSTIWKEWLDVQQNVLISVGKIIEAHGAEIAYPTRTLQHINH